MDSKVVIACLCNVPNILVGSLLAAWHPCSVKYHKGTYLNFWNFSMVYVEGLGKAMVWLLASRSMGGSCMACLSALSGSGPS